MANLTRLKLKHIVLLGACSLALSASSVLCNGYPNAAPMLASNVLARDTAAAGSEARAGQQRQSQNAPAHYAQDLITRQSLIAPMSSNVFSEHDRFVSPIDSDLTGPNNQPNVYHSIIDRTDAPSGRRQASSAIQTSAATNDGDLHTAAGHHHGHAYGKYYEYRAVPKKKTWKFGYKRGNHKHTISRHEHGKAGKHPHFKTKVKWHDKKSKGKGIHLWDYNHHDKKHHYG